MELNESILMLGSYFQQGTQRSISVPKDQLPEKLRHVSVSTLHVLPRLCVCVCVRVRACVHVSMRVCVCMCWCMQVLSYSVHSCM